MKLAGKVVKQENRGMGNGEIAAYSKWKKVFQAELPRSFWHSVGKNCDLDRLTYLLFNLWGETGARSFKGFDQLRRTPKQALEALAAARKQLKKTIVAVSRLSAFFGKDPNLEQLKKALVRSWSSLRQTADLTPAVQRDKPRPALSRAGLIHELQAWDFFLHELITRVELLAVNPKGRRLRVDKMKLAIAACEEEMRA